MEVNMRKAWFEHVQKTRRKMQRQTKDKNTTHREAMTAASGTWGKEKVKIQNRIKRERRKAEKAKLQPKREEKKDIAEVVK